MILRCTRAYHLSVLKVSKLKLRFARSLNCAVLNNLTDMPKKKSFGKIYSDHSYFGIEVFGNNSTTSPCAVSLNTRNHCYLFNCGEGVQRIFTEFRVKPSKYRDIFVTYPSWKNIGGLLGTILAMQESNIRDFVTHGHACLGSYITLMRSYVNLKGIQQNVKVYEQYTEFSDECITVKAVVLNCSKEIPGLKKNSAISYIVHSKKSFGALLLEKCFDLGVPAGPLLGKLKNGEDVELENGTIVKSSDVKLPDNPGCVAIVVECPSEDYLDSLLNEPAFFKHEKDNEDIFGCSVIHFSSCEIVKNEKYQEWISRFAKDTKHIFVNDCSDMCAYVGTHRNQFKLNMLHPEIFPLLQRVGLPDFPRVENSVTDAGHVVLTDIPINLSEKNSHLHVHSDKTHFQCVDNNNIYGEPLCEIVMKPKKMYDYTKCLTLKKNEFLNEVMQIPDVNLELEKLKEKIKEIEKEFGCNGKIYPKIVFLGTGSKKPSKTRNVSGILVYCDESKSIILDCGECTYYQLLIFYGKEKVKEILRNLQAVFISHTHVDHYIGLPKLIMERKHAFDELKSRGSDSISSEEFKPLVVIAPIQLMPFLHFFSKEIFDISDLYKLYPCRQFFNSSAKEQFSDIFNNLNLESIQTTSVRHAPNSFGVAIKHLDGWKLTYSGDTMPCKNLISIGQDSDILIHEATFDDIYEKEAKQKLHSTTGQAISMGRQMNAKFTLLTHFSQRYCHIPMIGTELLTKQDVGVAFDFMQISPYQLPILPHLYEPIKLVFSSDQERLIKKDTALRLKRDRNSGIFPDTVINKIPKTSDV